MFPHLTSRESNTGGFLKTFHRRVVMLQFLDLHAMKFILVMALVTAILVIADLVLLEKRKGTSRLQGLFPAVDSILVIAGFMAFTGTCLALIGSAGRLAMRSSNDIPSELILTVILSAFTTTLIAWSLFFFFFEVWVLLRLLFRKQMKKLTASL
jgi:hypothetical protein